MKKPILLLVDDDASVLEALTAELTPAFGEICRIEAFTEPGEVLSAVQGWATEKRPIALAIVDQLMPGMSGTELLQAIRQRQAIAPESAHGFAATGKLKAILLTGYAGLPSAVVAKNLANADRYLEKPWSAQVLQDALRGLLSIWLCESGHDSYFVYREAVRRSEVEALLRLRLQVYRQLTYLASIVPPAEAGFDLDTYDMVSRFYALFLAAKGTRVLIGGVRVTDGQPGPAAGIVTELAQSHPELARRVACPRKEQLPLLTYWPDRASILGLLDRIRAEGGRYAEPGRLCLSPQYHSRGAAAQAGHLARHMLRGTVASFLKLGVHHAMLTCSIEHVLLYRPLGFAPPPMVAAKCFIPAQGVERCILYGRLDSIPDDALAIVDAMGAQIEAFGEACRCPAFGDCLSSAYRRRDFTGSDLFCPATARRILEQAIPDEETDPAAG